MRDLIKHMNFFSALADFVLKRRITVIVFGFLVALGLMAGAPNLNFDTDARVFFDKNNPDRIALDKFEAAYSKDDNLIFIISPKDKNIFTAETLKAIGQLTEESWLLPYVRTVNSLTNYQNSYAEEDSLVVEDLITDINNISPEDVAKAQEVAKFKERNPTAVVRQATVIAGT